MCKAIFWGFFRVLRERIKSTAAIKVSGSEKNRSARLELRPYTEIILPYSTGLSIVC